MSRHSPAAERRAPSRRDFFRLAGLASAGGCAVFAAACGDGEGSPAAGGGTERGDARLLDSALELELAAVAAYTAGAELLRGSALATAKLFRDQEQEHAHAIRQAIKDLGGTPKPPRSADDYARDFPPFEDQSDVLSFAVDLERDAVSAYLDALPRLGIAELRGTAAAIATCEAEHLSVLLGALGRQQVPEALV